MRILAFDTCFDAVSVAAGVRDEAGCWQVTEQTEVIGKGHAEKLLPQIRSVMKEAGLTFDDLDRIAVTNGPGGFTGLRAGLAAARGLALASGKPLVAIGSLELIALAAARQASTEAANAPLVVAMDARKADVFLQIFGSFSINEPLYGPALCGSDDIGALLPQGMFSVAGSGADAVIAAAAAAGRRDVRELVSVPATARDMLETAAERPAAKTVNPIYLRPPDAKPQQSQRIARSGA